MVGHGECVRLSRLSERSKKGVLRNVQVAKLSKSGIPQVFVTFLFELFLIKK